ncbi:MAG TPA: M28 family peptidase [Actinomycetota bacterium]|nr:M28 family peptidase [Actinomycetota bacterium]
MRRTILILLATLAVASLPPASPIAASDPTILAHGPFSSDAAFVHVRRLAGRIGPRPAGTTAYRRAVRYVDGKLTGLGYDTRLQRFPLPRGGRSWNVIATSPTSTAVRLLIGAHLDTVAGSPGGNDNASGVAVLLEIARSLAGSAATDGLTLVAFGAEEFQPKGGHHIGSDAYVDRMTAAERDALEIMVSVDMIGKVRPLIAARLRGTSPNSARELARAARASGTRASVRTLGDISDHGPFALAGMPAAFLWTGLEPNHHLPTDVVRNVAPRSLRRSGDALLELVDRLLGPA